MSTVLAFAVRDAVRADAAGLSRLLGQLGHPSPPERVGRRLEALARRGETRVLVASAGDQPLGFLALARLDLLPYPAPLARITALCVDESARGAGVGSALEAAAASIARGWGCDRIEVTSNRRRVRAHGFYARLGYEETHRHFVKRVVAGAAAGGTTCLPPA